MPRLMPNYDPEWDKKWDVLKAKFDAGERFVCETDADWIGLAVGTRLDHALGLMPDRQFRTTSKYYAFRQEFGDRWTDAGRLLPYLKLSDQPTIEEVEQALAGRNELLELVNVGECLLDMVGRGKTIDDVLKGGIPPLVGVASIDTDDAWTSLSAEVRVPESGRFEFYYAIMQNGDATHLGLVDRPAAPIGQMGRKELSWVAGHILRCSMRYEPSWIEYLTGRCAGPETYVWTLDCDTSLGVQCRKYGISWSPAGPYVEAGSMCAAVPAILAAAWFATQPKVAELLRLPLDPDHPQFRPRAA